MTNDTTTADLATAIDFLLLISPNTDTFQFQQIHDKDDRALKPVHLAFEQLDQLTTGSANGYGTFFTVNEIPKGARRQASNVTKIRAVYADDDTPRDNGPRTDWALVPSIAVQSSPGKYHYYWLIEGDMSIETAEGIKRSIANTYTTDWAGVAGPNRVLRLPGFKHQKREAYTSNYIGGDRRYTEHQLIEAFGIMRHEAPQQGDFSGDDHIGITIRTEFINRDALIRETALNEYHVVCPWAKNHSDKTDVRANFLFAGTGGYAHTTFYCHHDSCVDKHVDDVAEFFSIDVTLQSIELIKDLLPAPLKEIDEDDPMAWADAFIITDAERNAITDSEYIVPGLIVKGHVVVIVAPPNGGKTTIMWDVSKNIIRKAGFDVYYVNADIAPADAKQMDIEAKKHGIKLLLPDFKIGQSMSTVVNKMIALSNTNVDLSNSVFIFDTLKKMTNVIHKTEAKALYAMLRRLSARGATVIPLGHTNKYPDADGNLIYEGTGDLRSDVDELIYLYNEKVSDGTVLVSSKADKVRAVIEDMTWRLYQDRTVERQDSYVDTQGHAIRKKEVQKDLPVIAEVRVAIDAGIDSQTEIIKELADTGVCGRTAARRVLSKYEGEFWEMKKGGQNNKIKYETLASDLL